MPKPLLADEVPGYAAFHRTFRIDLGEGKSASIALTITDRHSPRDRDLLAVPRPPSNAELFHVLGKLTQRSLSGV